jgi:DNA invertase Pin-like site-specific DNA recombinase
MKRAIELIRVSTEGQAADDRGGIPAQRAANLRTASVHGLQVVRTFQIEDVSGAKVLASPEMQELLRLIESPEISGVVAREFSRLMRPEDLGDFAILQRFIETKTLLYLPDGIVDLSNKSGKLFGILRAAMAGFERTEIAERMNSGKEAIRRAGGHAGGDHLLPYGVAWDEKEGWRFTLEAEKVKEAFRQVLTTARPYSEIAAELGIPRTNLRVILQNPIWLGFRVYDSKRDISAAGYIAGENGRHGYRRKVARDAAEVVRVKVLPKLISESDFQRVQEILADRAARERIIRSQHAPRYQFNGYLSCAVCGEPLYTHSNVKAPYYICKLNNARARKRGLSCANPYVLAGKLDAKIQTVLAERLQEKKLVKQVAEMYLSGAQEAAGVAPVNLEASKALIASLEAKRARVLDAYFEGAISKPERDKRLAAIDAELAGCNRVIEGAIQRPAPTMTTKQLAALLEVFAAFRFLGRDQKRSIMAASRARVFTSGYVVEKVELSGLKPLEHQPNQGHNVKVSSYVGNPFPAVAASPPARCAETPGARPETKRRYVKAKLRRVAG